MISMQGMAAEKLFIIADKFKPKVNFNTLSQISEVEFNIEHQKIVKKLVNWSEKFNFMQVFGTSLNGGNMELKIDSPELSLSGLVKLVKKI